MSFAQTAESTPNSTIEQTAGVLADTASVAQLRKDFLALDDFPRQLQRLIELEQQALQLAVDEPLKLGSLGSAILDIYPASQAGQYVLAKFYGHVESEQAQANHLQSLATIQATMLASGDGSLEKPYEVMSPLDAHAYERSQGNSPVGSMYRTREEIPLSLLLVSKLGGNQAKLLDQRHFNLSHIVTRVGEQTPAHDPQENAWALIRLFASRMDTAAQTAIGAYLTSAQKYEDALGWLKVAARADNVLANTLLARIYWTQAEAAETDEQKAELLDLALENHLHAITLGSTESMYTLANLYLNDYYGEENRHAAVPLLAQAGERGHAEALLYLGHLYNAGNQVKQDTERAGEYFAKAAALDNPQAILNYARFLTNQAAEKSSGGDHKLIIKQLRNLADTDDTEAMVVLGNVYARGVGVKPSNKRAIRWYKKAVNTEPANADIVNEVAWTLTVSDVKGLPRHRYAKKIMDELMASDEQAGARPEYLDTWAATHAAVGEFPRAIELQEQAIATARAQQRDDVIKILQEHLDRFKAGDRITEKAP
jgi:TPR repeat protein